MAIEDKLDYLLETKKQIKNSITEKGVEVLETDTFRSYADKIKQISGGSSETDEWQPDPDWYDIESILENDTEECIGKAIVLVRDDVEEGIASSLAKGAYKYNVNGETFINANTTSSINLKNTLKEIQGKSCSKGYNTKYIIYYINSNTTNIVIPDSSLYVIFKNFNFSCNLISSEDLIDSPFREKRYLEGIKFINSKIEGYKANGIFFRCNSLQSVVGLDTKDITSMYLMFGFCISLKTVTQIDTSKVTYMDWMFQDCWSLREIPQIDTSNVSYTQYMFKNCYLLKDISLLNLTSSSVRYGMFYGCSSLINVPNLNMIGSNSNEMFYNCYSLETIPKLNMKNINNTTNMFKSCTKLFNIEQIYNISTNIDFSACKYLTYETLIRILNALITTTTKTLTLGSTNLSKLTNEEKAIAINKRLDFSIERRIICN